MGATSADPGLAVEAFEFIAEEIGVRVVAGRQGRGNGLGVRSRHSASAVAAISFPEIEFREIPSVRIV